MLYRFERRSLLLPLLKFLNTFHWRHQMTAVIPSSAEAGPGPSLKGIIAVDMDDVLWRVLLV